jgi:hypothetical protein
MPSESVTPVDANPDFGPGAIYLDVPSGGRAWIVPTGESIPEELRRAAFATHSKDFRYYEVLELTLSGQFEFRYLVLRDEASGEWAIQPLFFVNQDLLGGLPLSLKSVVNPIRKIWPRFLTLRMLMIGCAAGEGQLDHASPWLVPALQTAIDVYRRQAGASLILFKDFPSTYRVRMDQLAEHGYQRAPSMPAATLSLDFASFEDYMTSRLSKVFRKNLRRKLRALDDAAPVVMEVLTDASAYVDEIYALYYQTFKRSDFKFEELNKDYFTLLGQRMPDRVRYFIWRQNGRIIAFNLCVIHDDTIYDLDVGLDYAVALDLHLYFVTWRDVIEWGLRNGIKTYHTGPLNYDPKAHLRLSLAPLDLYARHNSPWINPFFKVAIKYLEPTRHDPVLKNFPNFHELK